MPRATADDPTLARDAELFYGAFQELLRAYQFRDRERTGCRGVSIIECYALEAVEREEPLTVNRLAELLAVDKSRASRLAGEMERKGLLVRRREAADGRLVHVGTSPAGRSLHAAIRGELIERQQRLLAALSPASRRAAIRLLKALRDDLRERTCAAPAPAPEPTPTTRRSP